jgi:hypothetical protein
MNHLCPICNGFFRFSVACPACGGALADAGRLYDYYGDYSPYLEIDDAKGSNGLPDRMNHVCIHVGWCSSCRREQRINVPEWDERIALLPRSPQLPGWEQGERVR